MTAADLEYRERVQRLPGVQQVAGVFRMRAGTLFLLGHPEVLIGDLAECIGRLEVGLDLIVCWVLPVRDQSQ